MKFIVALFAGLALTTTIAVPADPLRIGVDAVLSGPNAERGQQEQDAIEPALAEINAAGGVLGRPVEADYGDSAANPAQGVQALHRLIDERHGTYAMDDHNHPHTPMRILGVRAGKIAVIATANQP